MLIDIHTHTIRYSGCSILSPLELIEGARKIGLDGIVITEHNHLWSADEVRELQKELSGDDFVILRGQEVDTDTGHVLVYGYNEPFPWGISIEDIEESVHHKGGVIVLAHPFRWGALGNMCAAEQAAVLSYFDGIEVYNGNCSRAEIKQAEDAARRLGLSAMGGSDAHSIDMLGKYCTEFYDKIASESELVAAIAARRYTPASCRFDFKASI